MVDLSILAKIVKMNAKLVPMSLSLTKHTATLHTALKYAVSVSVLVYIGYRINSITFTKEAFFSLTHLNILIPVVLLTVFNWNFEILKWQLVVSTFSSIGFKKAAYQTLVAYTYGIITPFNSGNYAKKVFFYAKTHRKRIVFLNLSKGIYQMAVTCIFGSWGVFKLMTFKDLYFPKQLFFALVTGLTGAIVLFNYRKKAIHFIKSIPFSIHIKLLLYSIAKYLCFSVLLLLLLYKQGFSIETTYAGISAVYLISSLVPILNILDFAIKGSVALWLFIPLGYSEQTIVIAYFVLWICNYALPAVLGSFLQFYTKKNKTA